MYMNRSRLLVSILVALWSLMRRSMCYASNNASSSSSSANSTTTLVDCRLCSEANATPSDPYARFQGFAGQQVLTCQQVYDKGTFQLSSSECHSLQAWGSALCLCSTNNSNSTNPSNSNCSLCEDGSTLPIPTYEGLPSTTCAQLQVEAKRDELFLCSTWQKTVGVYCQCNNTQIAQSACHLCGQFPLPNPLLDANNTNYTTTSTSRSSSSSSSTSCGEVEFQANLPQSSCSDFQQLYGGACCQNLVVPTLAPKSRASAKQHFPASLLSASLLAILLTAPFQ